MGKFLDIKRRKERLANAKFPFKQNKKRNANGFNFSLSKKRSFKPKYDKAEYHKYLQSDRWKIFRELALEFHGRNCGSCGSRFLLEVHHKHYKNIFHESFADVMILCKPCHHREHKNKLFRNGRKSKYMRDPNYYAETVTYYPNNKILSF